MDLQTFEKLKNKHGLVPMEITVDFAPYFEGSIAGFPPEEAWRLYKRKHAVPVEKDSHPAESSDDDPKANATSRVASETVEIPDDWEQLHHLQRIQLAKRIVPGEPNSTVIRADEIIRAELERRGKDNAQQNETGNPGAGSGSPQGNE